MNANTNLARRARRISAAARSVKLSAQLAHRSLECEQLIAVTRCSVSNRNRPRVRGGCSAAFAPSQTLARSPSWRSLVPSRSWWGRWWLRWRQRAEPQDAGAIAQPAN
jgi:hypothetical protein